MSNHYTYIDEMKWENIGYILLRHGFCYIGPVKDPKWRKRNAKTMDELNEHYSPEQVCRAFELMVFKPKFEVTYDEVKDNGSFRMVLVSRHDREGRQ